MNDVKWLKNSGENVGEFVVISPIGVGGMGEIYLCRDIRLNRNVAVKLVSDRGGDSAQEAGERLIREARLIAQAHHPNIATIFSMGMDESIGDGKGVPFIAMEYIQGESLHGLIQACRLNLPEVLQIMAEIGSALQVAHDEGILHRDIKPTNILLDRYGFSKLIDFGIASGRVVRKAGGQESTVEGTLNYMAPEMLEGFSPSVQTDIYALGIVLFEMLTGEIPFLRGSQEETIYEIKNIGISLEQLNGQLLPAELIEILSRATARSPEMRFQTATEFVAAIRALDVRSFRDVYLHPLRSIPESIISSGLVHLRQSGLHRVEWPFVLSRALALWNYTDRQFSTTSTEEFIPDDVMRASISSIAQSKRERREAQKAQKHFRPPGPHFGTDSAKRPQLSNKVSLIKSPSSTAQSGSFPFEPERQDLTRQDGTFKRATAIAISLLIGFLLGVALDRLVDDQWSNSVPRLPAGLQELFRNQK